MKIHREPVIVTCILLNLLGLTVFLHGFFPIKHSVPGYATIENITEPKWWQSDLPPVTSTLPHGPLYDRLVVVLVDALRADFVLPGSGRGDLPVMKFVSELIAREGALGYTARAHVPTVTLPRIKALTTGGIPGFVDVVLNFDSKSLQEDNIVSQLRRARKRIVFYGDDTWMGLFPNHFARAEGTTSFFVTDYTQVDLNVSRHVSPELARGDWDVMILHYLGLDHIGHLAGPHSPLVAPKLAEMDAIVRNIYENVTARDAETGQSTLLMLCGDHGMSDQGSHGGSSDSEVLTPLVLMGGSLPHQTDKDATIDQIDVAPTLALLLGIPVPQNSLGTFIVDVVRGMTPRDRLKAAYSNAQQLLKILKMNVQDYENEPCFLQLIRAFDAHTSWLQSLDQGLDPEVLRVWSDRILDQYHQALKLVGERVSGTLAEYDLHSMTAGVVVLWAVLTALVTLFLLPGDATDLPLTAVNVLTFFLVASLLTFAHIWACTSEHGSDSLCSLQGAAMLLVLGIVAFVSASFVFILKSWQHTSKTVYDCRWLRPLTMAGVLYTLSLLSSSFVEEEHQTWYFFAVSVLILYTVHSLGVTGQSEKHNVVETQGPTQYMTGIEEHEHLKNNPYMEREATDMALKARGKSRKAKPCENHAKEKTETGKYVERKGGSVVTLLGHAAVALVLCRMARSWNQTGDKWAHLPDIGDWLVRPENKCTLSALVVLSMVLAICLVAVRTRSVAMTTLYTLGALSVYAFRTASGALSVPWGSDAEVNSFHSGVVEARCAYFFITFLLFHAFHKLYRHRKPTSADAQSSTATMIWQQKVSALCDAIMQLQIAWSLFALLILRPHNITFAVFVIYLQYCSSNVLRGGSEMSVPSLTLVYYCLGQASFYYQGNSNSITTVDVSAGYVGLSDYSPTVIGLLLGLSTYVFPIFWHLSLLHAVLHTARRWHWNANRLRRSFTACVLTLGLCRTIPVAVYVVMVTAQRHHLFVWSVFSPKLLYEGMHTVVVSVLMCATLALRHVCQR